MHGQRVKNGRRAFQELRDRISITKDGLVVEKSLVS